MLLQPNMYLLIATAFLLLGISSTDAYFLWVWLWASFSFFCVALAYVLNKPEIFRKRADGSIPYVIRWTLWPFLWATQLFNSIARRHDIIPPIQEVEPGLFLARRLFPSDLHTLRYHDIVAVLDVTAEFNSLNWTLLEEGMDYLNVPILDHSVPSSVQVVRALNWIHTHRKRGRSVLVHCALGRGRSVFVMAAYLLSQNAGKTPAGVVKEIKEVRRSAHLNKRQFHVLSKMFHANKLIVRNRAWLIVNPAAGAHHWEQHRPYVVEMLSPYFELTIHITSKVHRGGYWARQALAAHADVVVACGGDGTVMEVSQALVNTSMKLGIIPLGTVNALHHVLCGVSVTMNPIETACLALIEGAVSRVDTARCNQETMLLLCGLGFEQQMMASAERKKKNILGPLAYIQGLSEAVSANVVQSYTVSIDDGHERVIETPSLTIANAAPVTTLLAQGHGAPDMNDGLLDITWLSAERAPILNLVELLGHGLRSRTEVHEYEGVRYATGRKISIRSEAGVSYVLDGEGREADELIIEIQPKSLSVIAPAVEDVSEEALQERAFS